MAPRSRALCWESFLAVFSILDDDPSAVREGFEKARGFFRSRVGETLQLRRVPELRFRHDTSARRGVEIGRLIDEGGAPNRPRD